MSVFRTLTEEEQAALGLSNLDVLLSTRASEATLNSVLAAINSSNEGSSGLNQEATQLLVKACLDSINDNTASTLNEVSFNGKLLQVDSVGTTTYIGYAVPGSLVSVTGWAIKKIVENGGDVSITWADSNKDFDNIWDDRLTLTYS